MPGVQSRYNCLAASHPLLLVGGFVYFCQHDREYEQRLVHLLPLAALHSIYVCMYLFCSASDQTRALHMLGKHSLSSLMATY